MKEKLTTLTYFPFFGWMFSMAIWPENENIRFHVKQAFITAAFFTLVLTGLSFIKTIFPESSWIMKLILTILIYLAQIVYFSLCIAGTVLQQKEKQISFPVVSRYFNRVDI